MSQPQGTAPTVPTEANDAPISPAQQTQQPLTRRLDAAEHLWLWKGGLRAILVLVGLIGVGCAGWVLDTCKDSPYYGGYYSNGYDYGFVWPFITFGISIIWCSICILVLILRRPNAPVHPGLAVAMDLLLWLGYIPTIMFAFISMFETVNFGSDGDIPTLQYYGNGNYDYYSWGSSDGNYQQARNGTFVWIEPSSSSRYYTPEPRDCDLGMFSSCAELDAHVNAVYAAKGHRGNVMKCAVACQLIGLFLHLVLFIWACVDTARRNRRKVSKDAEKLASDIVMNMIKNGAIVPGQGQAGRYQQLPSHPPQQHQSWAPQQNYGQAPNQPQAWPLHQQQQQQQQQQIWNAPVQQPQPVVFGQEKDGAARFA